MATRILTKLEPRKGKLMPGPKKCAIMVWGGWEGHEPKQCVEVFVPFLEGQGFQVEVSDTLDVFLHVALMQSVDLIVPAWSMGTITQEQERALLTAVGQGAGIAGIATAPPRLRFLRCIMQDTP